MKTSWKKEKTWQLTKPWEKIICVLGIPILINTLAAIYFTSRTAAIIAILITAIFVYDVVKRRRGKVIWDLDNLWERVVYVVAWISFILAIVLIILSFFTNALKF
ncbi:MAG: hypothetical protein V1914_03870 [archaeon]